MKVVANKNNSCLINLFIGVQKIIFSLTKWKMVLYAVEKVFQFTAVSRCRRRVVSTAKTGAKADGESPHIRLCICISNQIAGRIAYFIKRIWFNSSSTTDAFPLLLLPRLKYVNIHGILLQLLLLLFQYWYPENVQ